VRADRDPGRAARVRAGQIAKAANAITPSRPGFVTTSSCSAPTMLHPGSMAAATWSRILMPWDAGNRNANQIARLKPVEFMDAILDRRGKGQQTRSRVRLATASAGSSMTRTGPTDASGRAGLARLFV
jgi:hypothetical protein